nr:MAG TPA: hypothetical protein [Herelleviridae sp.]
MKYLKRKMVGRCCFTLDCNATINNKIRVSGLPFERYIQYIKANKLMWLISE